MTDEEWAESEREWERAERFCDVFFDHVEPGVAADRWDRLMFTGALEAVSPFLGQFGVSAMTISSVLQGRAWEADGTFDRLEAEAREARAARVTSSPIDWRSEGF